MAAGLTRLLRVSAGLLDEQLERRTTTPAHGGARAVQTPHTMQWAVRQRESAAARPAITANTPATGSKYRSHEKNSTLHPQMQ